MEAIIKEYEQLMQERKETIQKHITNLEKIKAQPPKALQSAKLERVLTNLREML